MKKFKSLLFHSGYVALAFLMLSGCDSISSDDSSADAVASYDGQAIFRGLFFGQGEAASLFPEIWEQDKLERRVTSPEEAKLVREFGSYYNRKTRESTQAHEAYGSIANWIHEEEPEFFDRFGDAMRSGQHLKTKAAIEEGTSVLLRAIDALTGVDAMTIPVMSIEGNLLKGDPVANGRWVYRETAVVGVFAAVVVVVLVAIDFAPIEAGASSLRFEQIVDNAVVRLGGSGEVAVSHLSPRSER